MCCAQSLWSVVFTTSYLSQQIASCYWQKKKRNNSPGRRWEIFWQLYRRCQSDGSHWVLCNNVCCSVFVFSFSVLVAGCGVCKRMQPIFQQAATETKGKYVSLLNLPPPPPPPRYCINCLWSAADLLWCLQIRWNVSAVNVWIVSLRNPQAYSLSVFSLAYMKAFFGCISCKTSHKYNTSGTFAPWVLIHQDNNPDGL